MLNEDLLNLSKSRLLHAYDCLKEAEILLNADEYRGTANRAYYAAFHALRAVLILDNFDSKKHSGIIAKFRELYLKTELFDKEMSNEISSSFAFVPQVIMTTFILCQSKKQLNNCKMQGIL